ncbi:MAG: sigma-70 family RNA polymerase sigma factor [Clostridia bacterium]|nr:sigma-70 family RNA polymerase sigma factor [Clostridia bacterium]
MRQDNLNGIGMEDKQIIELYWQREERAITETDHKYGRYLYTIAYNIVHNRSDCEECLNDTYLGTWNRIPPAKPTAFQAFLSRIMRNIAIDRYRKATADKRVPSELVISMEELEDYMVYDTAYEEEQAVAELVRVLNDYLRGVSDRDAMIFVCRYYYSDKVSEIARMLNVSERTVQRELLRIRESLRTKLMKEGIYHE